MAARFRRKAALISINCSSGDFRGVPTKSERASLRECGSKAVGFRHDATIWELWLTRPSAPNPSLEIGRSNPTLEANDLRHRPRARCRRKGNENSPKSEPLAPKHGACGLKREAMRKVWHSFSHALNPHRQVAEHGVREQHSPLSPAFHPLALHPCPGSRPAPLPARQGFGSVFLAPRGSGANVQRLSWRGRRAFYLASVVNPASPHADGQLLAVALRGPGVDGGAFASGTRPSPPSRPAPPRNGKSPTCVWRMGARARGLVLSSSGVEVRGQQLRVPRVVLGGKGATERLAGEVKETPPPT